VCVQQDEYVAVERLGAFQKMLSPGFACLGPDIAGVCFNVRRVSSRVDENKMITETKTKDNVFVKIAVAVQVEIIKEKAYESIYKLTNVEKQLESFVADVVRGQAPKMKLDELFEAKEQIATAVKERLSVAMAEFGYKIHQVLITDLRPDDKVKAAMNDINANQRLRMAAQDKGEAEKILQVKNAEAEAEGKRLRGQGIARQRTAIIEGLRSSVGGPQGLGTDRVQELLLMSTYFDTLEHLSDGRAHTVFMPEGVNGERNVADDFRDGMMQAMLSTGGYGSSSQQSTGGGASSQQVRTPQAGSKGKAPAPPSKTTLTVAVPDGARGGMELLVPTPSGQQVKVKIPAGMQPGQTFQISF